jgi:hypothetical protein
MAGPTPPPPPGVPFPGAPFQTESDPDPSAPGGPQPAFGRARDGSWVGGAILIGIGFAFLAGQLIPHAGNFIVLAIGVTFLAAFVVTREYGFLVPGGIVTGVGTGVVIAAEMPGAEGGALFMLAIGSGFLAIWIIGLIFHVPENHPWPLVPGLILGGIGAASLAGTRYAEIGRLGWPIALIALGAALLLRAMVRRPGG